jgi:predicted O-linked N-acetylglucosamine transferase (SPINDLY family)
LKYHELAMPVDPLTTALLNSMAHNFSVADLIRTAETLKLNGQGQAVESLYAVWLQHNRDNPLTYAALFNYSVVLSDAGKLEAAKAALESAIASNPDFLPAYINLGRVHERLGSTGQAILQWTLALAKLGTVTGQGITYKTTALNQSARALEGANEDEAAEGLLRQSLELDTTQREVVQHYVALRQRQCSWPVLATPERVAPRTLVSGMSPLSAAAFTDDPIYQLGLAASYNRQDVGTPTEQALSWPATAPHCHQRPLKIGYLSSDLREHAVGYLMTEVFALHDRSRVEVFAYYCGPESRDALHSHFRATADHFTSINELDDVSAARRIAADGIDILVDLNGYTREARLKVVALRPAPIIVNWLGFPGTMGSPYHHYLIADDWIVPPTHEHYYTEKVLRLPCYQPNNRRRAVASEPLSRKDVGLPEDAVVYCCFNGAHKLTRFTLERWLIILSRVEGSVLWLLGSTDKANERLRDYAAARGIERERIVFASKLANPYHLARYPLSDLFLDTTPYGAHTTASDALYMGVPVLTLSGRSFASRVCGSLVRSAGLDELVCTKAEDYVEQGIALGRDAAKRAEYRQRLREAHDLCPLFDMPLLTRHLETLYDSMWQDYRDGRLPEPALTNLEEFLEIAGEFDHEGVEQQTLDDYEARWAAHLARRHRVRPLVLDPRLERLWQATST